MKRNIINVDLARKLISHQFPEFSDLPIACVEKQGHDNHTYRLGSDMLIRMPTAADYALNCCSFSVHTLLFPRFFMSFPRKRESSKYLKE